MNDNCLKTNIGINFISDGLVEIPDTMDTA